MLIWHLPLPQRLVRAYLTAADSPDDPIMRFGWLLLLARPPSPVARSPLCPLKRPR